MGNFSRDTFDKLKHYVGVRLQQGVPLVDADWNEQEDIRKFELQSFLKWFVGNGVPKGNDGFAILPVNTRADNDFIIKGGDGTPEGAGRCLVDGWDVINESDIKYTEQALFDNTSLANTWGVPVLKPLAPPETGTRTDLVYLDVWEREVNAEEDTNLINTDIRVETCARLRREWVVRVRKRTSQLPAVPQGHVIYPLAIITRTAGKQDIEQSDIKEEGFRTTGLNLVGLSAEISDARGIKANLGSRLDESLTKGGQLLQNVVGKGHFTSELNNSFNNIESHLSRADNPHNVTVDQIGALAMSAYEFSHRSWDTLTFTQNDANGAQRSPNIGFRPKFVWAVGSCRAKLLDNSWAGVNAYGYADLRGSIIQRCTDIIISRYATAPYLRQDTSTRQYLCHAQFYDKTSSVQCYVILGAYIHGVSESGLTVRFRRVEPSTTTTGGGANRLSDFNVKLDLLFLG